jgi:hypothetical protein
MHPQSIHAQGPTMPNPTGEDTSVARWVTAPTAAELDELLVRVAHMPGITDVLLWYASSTLPVRAWLDERIESMVRLSNLVR